MTWLLIGGAVIALGMGIWIGLGAPGWPYKPEASPHRLKQRSINPVAWGRSTGRERLSPRRPEDRRPRLR
ncbi:MAG TPA: hypothetical protein VFZ18_02455 [Longimicrobiaceae bacterium]